MNSWGKKSEEKGHNRACFLTSTTGSGELTPANKTDKTPDR